MSISISEATANAHLDGTELGKRQERERIIELIKSGGWSGLSLAEDQTNLIALIKGEQK